MIPLPNSVRKQALRVRCDSAEEASALRIRLADFNRSHLLPVIERVLAEASRQGTHIAQANRIQLEGLHVDLGVFSLNEVEALAPTRLYDALSEALRDAIRNNLPQEAASGEYGWIALLEVYLLSGTLPFWAPNTDSFSPGEIFTELADLQPVELASMFRRIGRDNDALERVVQQLLPEQLRDLIGLLEPSQSDLILAYLADAEATNREERLTDLAEGQFSRLLWRLVLTYLLQDPGSQFNRKVFVRSLLTGIAGHAGVAYADILGILAGALQKMMRHAGLRSSLPAVIGELIEVEKPASARLQATSSVSAVNSAKAGQLNGGQIETLVRLLFPDLPSDTGSQKLAEQLRYLANDRQALERAVARLQPEEFRTVVRLLEPEHAPLVFAYILDIAAINRVEKQTILSETNFELLLRHLALSYLLREPGSQFNRKAFVNSVIAGMAARHGVSFSQVLDLLGRGLQAVSDPQIMRSSLPGIIRELLQESGTAEGTMDFEPAVGPRNILIQLLPDLGIPGTPVAQALETALSQVSDPQALIARVIAAIRQGNVLNFEKLVAGVNADVASADEDSVESLKAAVLADIDSPPRGNDDVYWPLHELLRRDRRAGRLFLQSQMNKLQPSESLLKRLSAAQFESLLELLLEQPSPSLSSLVAACRQLPLGDRPTFDAMHAAILTQILRRLPVREPDPDFLGGIVSGIFKTHLSDRVRSALLTRIPADQIALRSILEADLPGAHANPELIVDWLFRGSPADSRRQEMPDRLDEFLRALSELSGTPAVNIRRALRRRISNPAHREHLARILPEHALAELVELLDPNAGSEFLSGAALISSAFAVSFRDHARASRAIHWTAVLEAVAAPGLSKQQRLALLFDKYIEALSADSPGMSAPASRSDEVGKFLRQTAKLASEAGHAELRSSIETVSARRSSSVARTEAPQKPLTLPPVRKKPAPAPAARAANQPLYVPNAGLVLVSPFLPHLFEQLQMLEQTDTGRRRWRDTHTASRAVHLLQYLVDGRTAAPEPSLVWNKVLCGLLPSTPAERAIEPSSRETEACDALLAAVLANWSTLSNTSVAGLRETFLQRQGKLERTSERNTLQVQRKTVDVLLCHVPWNFHLVFHNWMPEPVYVTW